MRLTRIAAHNVVGARRVAVELATPVTLFAGDNAAGKSSLAEAVRMALAGDVARVALKKEYSALVTEGAEAGEVEVTTADGDAYGMALPSGKGNAVKDDAALPYVLAPERFAAASPDERRALLFGLGNVATNREDVARRLKERGADPAKVEKVLPLLRAGFPDASKFAADAARDAKAAWRAVTNETYGSVKAEAWTAPVPESDPERVKAIDAGLAKIDASIAETQRNLGALEERAKLHDAQAAGRELAAKLPSLLDKLQRDEAELGTWQEKVRVLQSATGGPRTGTLHSIAAALNDIMRSDARDTMVPEHAATADALLVVYQAEFGSFGSPPPSDPADLQKAVAARDLMQRSVDNDRRDIANAEAAKSQAGTVDAFDVAALTHAREKLVTLRRDRAALHVEAEQRRAAIAAAQQAEQRTQQAALHHVDVVAWTLIADALAPSGIPSELLAGALEPLNARLAQSAEDTSWHLPAIDAEMAITAGGRPYRLLSESERWRVDAMLGEAIAHLSGWRLLILDRMDVLQPSARGELLGWLNVLADAGEVDTVLVFATLKAPASGLPQTIGAHWIERGEITQPALRRAA